MNSEGSNGCIHKLLHHGSMKQSGGHDQQRCGHSWCPQLSQHHPLGHRRLSDQPSQNYHSSSHELLGNMSALDSREPQICVKQAEPIGRFLLLESIYVVFRGQIDSTLLATDKTITKHQILIVISHTRVIARHHQCQNPVHSDVNSTMRGVQTLAI